MLHRLEGRAFAGAGTYVFFKGLSGFDQSWLKYLGIPGYPPMVSCTNAINLLGPSSTLFIKRQIPDWVRGLSWASVSKYQRTSHFNKDIANTVVAPLCLFSFFVPRCPILLPAYFSSFTACSFRVTLLCFHPYNLRKATIFFVKHNFFWFRLALSHLNIALAYKTLPNTLLRVWLPWPLNSVNDIWSLPGHQRAFAFFSRCICFQNCHFTAHLISPPNVGIGGL